MMSFQRCLEQLDRGRLLESFDVSFGERWLAPYHDVCCMNRQPHPQPRNAPQYAVFRRGSPASCLHRESPPLWALRAFTGIFSVCVCVCACWCWARPDFVLDSTRSAEGSAGRKDLQCGVDDVVGLVLCSVACRPACISLAFCSIGIHGHCVLCRGDGQRWGAQGANDVPPALSEAMGTRLVRRSCHLGVMLADGRSLRSAALDRRASTGAGPPLRAVVRWKLPPFVPRFSLGGWLTDRSTAAPQGASLLAQVGLALGSLAWFHFERRYRREPPLVEHRLMALHFCRLGHQKQISARSREDASAQALPGTCCRFRQLASALLAELGGIATRSTEPSEWSADRPPSFPPTLASMHAATRARAPRCTAQRRDPVAALLEHKVRWR